MDVPEFCVSFLPDSACFAWDLNAVTIDMMRTEATDRHTYVVLSLYLLMPKFYSQKKDTLRAFMLNNG
jgi:hypothetical protein